MRSPRKGGWARWGWVDLAKTRLVAADIVSNLQYEKKQDARACVPPIPILPQREVIEGYEAKIQVGFTL